MDTFTLPVLTSAFSVMVINSCIDSAQGPRCSKFLDAKFLSPCVFATKPVGRPMSCARHHDQIRQVMITVQLRILQLAMKDETRESM